MKFHFEGPGSKPNSPFHSDRAGIAFHYLSTSHFLGFVQRLGAGRVGYIHSLGQPTRTPLRRMYENDNEYS